jgi:hypothetical protein
MESNMMIEDNGLHFKVCACGCETTFMGRSNRKFLNTRHKSKVNNQIRSNRRKVLVPTFEKMELCYRLLQKIKEEGKLKVWMPISDLTRNGFDPNIPSTRLKDKKTGAEYMVLINFAYRVSDEGTKIIIVELNN